MLSVGWSEMRLSLLTYVDSKYLLKMQFFIQDYPNMAGFFDFRDYLFEQVENIALYLKKYHKNERHLCLHISSSPNFHRIYV